MESYATIQMKKKKSFTEQIDGCHIEIDKEARQI